MMEPITSLTNINVGKPDDLLITCASFEQRRCAAACHIMHNFSTRCALLVSFLSDTNVEGEQKKRESVEHLIGILKDIDELGAPRLVSVGPYDYFTLYSAVRKELELREIGLQSLNVTIDISCLTKIQLIFLLKNIFEENLTTKLRLVYTIPQRYNTGGDRFTRLSVGYFAPIPIPLKLSRSEVTTPQSRLAIVILGHEGQRTLSAWNRLNPDSTLLLFPISHYNDLMKTCKKENSFLLNLSQKRNSGVKRIDCDHLDPMQVKGQILDFLSCFTKTGNPRVGLVPFGPKPFVIGSLLALFDSKGISFDLVYPIPTRYNSNYSEGIRDTYALELTGILNSN